MHLPTLLALPLSFLLSTALARPVLDPSALDVEGSWRLPPSFLFPPPPTNLTYTANQGRGEREKRNVIKNPKVVLNPKNPAFESSARSLAAAARTSTTALYPAPTTVGTTREAVQTTTTTTPVETSSSSTTTSRAASTTSSAAVAQFTGQATYFYQYGAAGACGNYNPDSASIVALDSRLYGNMGQVSQYCGRELTITNTANGKSVVATVADTSRRLPGL
ncbi:hypothetical protein JCM10296v2_005408 [Rhodotorula toruloides]